MTIHLNRFIDRVQGQEARGSRDFVMTMSDARDLQIDITRLLLTLNDLREQLAATTVDSTITVRMDGGSF
jgi:hypothetical protein